MSINRNYQIKNPSDALLVAFTTALRSMEKWREVLMPVLDRAINDLKADGHLSTAFADAVEDFWGDTA